MSEGAVVNLFTVARVLLLGGIFLVLPLITRKGLLFGVYIGEEAADGDEARALRRSWTVGFVILMALCLLVGLGISRTGRPITGNITATVLLLIGALVLYLRTYYAARTMAPPAAARQAEIAIAPLESGEPKGATLAKVALGICLLAGIATVVHATLAYASMPDRVPLHFGPSGEPDAWGDKSFGSVMLVPTLNLVVCPFIALMALLTARAKRSVRGGSGGGSVEAQVSFRAATAYLLSGTALLTSLLMTFLSVQIVRVALSRTTSLGYGIWIISGVMLVFLFGALIWIMAKYGQGGARIERGSADAPLTDGLADNACWVWGVFYVNKDDPSFLVEKRFGLGYTINFGNWKAVVMLAVFLALLFGLTGLALIGGLS